MSAFSRKCLRLRSGFSAQSQQAVLASSIRHRRLFLLVFCSYPDYDDCGPGEADAQLAQGAGAGFLYDHQLGLDCLFNFGEWDRPRPAVDCNIVALFSARSFGPETNLFPAIT